MKKIMIQSPTRVDLAGGTLDLWPLYDFVGGALTINVAIDIWTSCEITIREDKKIILESDDLKKNWQFSDIQSLLTGADSEIEFYKSILKQFAKPLSDLGHGFELKTASQSPIGGGLGGSSSLVISVLKALHQLLNKELLSANQLVHLAHNIEAEMLRTPTGTQDYYAAVTGGLSVIEYSAHGVKQTVWPVKGTPIKENFLLIYTGRSHHSGLNNFEVFKSCVAGDQKVLGALRAIRDISTELLEVMQTQEWHKMPELFRREYDARIQLTPAFTSPEIEKLHTIGLKAGAEAVKICGAGGGGCVLVWVSPDKRARVIETFHQAGFKCLPAQPVEALELESGPFLC